MDRIIINEKKSIADFCPLTFNRKKLWLSNYGILSLIRYRFLLFAGVFPYILGTVMAFHWTGSFNLNYFIIGLGGLTLVLIGIECWNEYFDFKYGGDRAFLQPERPKVPHYYLNIGILMFGISFFIVLYLAMKVGLMLMLFAFAGGLSAVFYVASPIRLSYRGFGEIIIFLNYGPLLTIGSYYFQAKRIDFVAVIASLVPGFLLFSLALINEIPDYYSDRIVGKKNIVVRLGREKTVILSNFTLLLTYLIILIFVSMKLSIFLMLIFLTLPLVYGNFLTAKRHYEIARNFIPVIRGTIFLYTVIMTLFILNFVIKTPFIFPLF